MSIPTTAASGLPSQIGTPAGHLLGSLRSWAWHVTAPYHTPALLALSLLLVAIAVVIVLRLFRWLLR